LSSAQVGELKGSPAILREKKRRRFFSGYNFTKNGKKIFKKKKESET